MRQLPKERENIGLLGRGVVGGSGWGLVHLLKHVQQIELKVNEK